MIEATQSLLARFQRKLEVAPRPAPRQEDAARRSYRQAAAVLDCFVFKGLRPADAQRVHDDPRSLLFDDVAAASGGASEQLFTLDLSLRNEALRELGTRQAMRDALACNPGRPQTELQALWESYLATGALPALEALGYRELTQVCQVLSWLDRLDPTLPTPEHAQDWLRRRSVFASFEHLFDKDFTGRAAELEMLREHIGALPPKRGVEAAWQQLRAWLNLRPHPIMVIHGPGGVGKSALIGRLLWEHTVADHEAQVVFAYLTFDQPSLRVDATFTILREAAVQLELQYPEHADAFAEFRQAVLEFRDARGGLLSRQIHAPTRGARADLSLSYEAELHRHFAALLNTIGRRHVDGATLLAPVVLVFDTFEEVQYRDRESLAGFWRMLDQLQDDYPPLRAIIIGRAPVATVSAPTRKLREEALSELALPDRVELLHKLGITDTAMAQAVAEQVGGNPLTLRLAARVVTADSDAASGKGIDKLVTRRFLFFQISEQLIQGQLYRRVLQHIRDPNVRRLAHPGMVLRRVDPDVILHVLAKLCLPGVTTLDEARRLFGELRRESSLVVLDATDGALVYRPDIRRSLLHLLEQDRLDEVRRLRRAAIAYYSGQEGVHARGEELYHRLALGEDGYDTLDSRWLEGVQSTLASSLEEYADTNKAWLASRMSLEVPRSVYANADTAEWERNITRKVLTALSDGQAAQALVLLGERAERSLASPLFALEAKAHLQAPEHTALALHALERGIGSVSGSTNRGRLAELLWLKAQVCLMGPNPDALGADESLERAQQAITRAANPLPLLHVLGQRLLLRRLHTAAYAVPASTLQQQLAAVCEGLDTAQVYSAGFVANLAAEMLGKDLFPAAFQRLEPALGKAAAPVTFEALTSENLQGLDEYRQAWELHQPTALQAAV